MINEWLRKTSNDGFRRRKLICNDGFSMSVQASRIHYCHPRENNADFYTEVEIGYPSDVEDELIYYAEDRYHPTETVYGYVPVELVDKIISKHGGVVQEKTTEEDLWIGI